MPGGRRPDGNRKVAGQPDQASLILIVRVERVAADEDEIGIGGRGEHLLGHMEETLLSFPGPHPAGRANQLGIGGDIELAPELAGSLRIRLESFDLDAIVHHLNLA
jgi:hypothetical protein